MEGVFYILLVWKLSWISSCLWDDGQYIRRSR